MVSPETLFVAEEGVGPLVLLLHGQPGVHEHLGAVAQRLARFSTALSVDRPGYGRSPGGPSSMASQAELFAQLLEARASGPSVIVAHSYAGGIALILAGRHPSLVAGLVLVASIGGEGSIAPVDAVLAAPVVGPLLSAVSLGAYGLIAPFVARVGSSTALSSNVPMTPTASLLERHDVFVAEQRFILAERPEVDRAITAVTCPVVVIHGSDDLVVPLSAGRDLAARLEGSQFVELPRHGHLIPRDAPDQVARAVHSLLAGEAVGGAGDGSSGSQRT